MQQALIYLFLSIYNNLHIDSLGLATHSSPRLVCLALCHEALILWPTAALDFVRCPDLSITFHTTAKTRCLN